MSIPHYFIDQLRVKLLPSEVIRPYIRLQKRGREYLGLCPFHQEKTPSFWVNDEKRCFYCFGCQAQGDIIAFYMRVEGREFYEAVAHLASLARMPLPEESLETKEKDKKIRDVYAVISLAMQWFQQALRAKEGAVARAYLEQRGLSEEAVVKFGLGYAPKGRAVLYSYLKSKQVPEELAMMAGLIGRGEKGEYYDHFRGGRLIFPIMDRQGKVIAFGGRIIGEGQPKYVNSPDTVLFKKSEVLYAEHLARKPAHDAGKVVVAEGYMDVIALHMAGIGYAVAPLGTAVTETHLQLLWRLAKMPIFCLDGDAAGQRAMRRVALLALPLLKPGLSLSFTLLTQGKDPDEVIKQHGAKTMERLLLEAKPLAEQLWTMEREEYGVLAIPEMKAAFEERLEQLVKTIADTKVSGYYRSFFKERIWQEVKSFDPRGKLAHLPQAMKKRLAKEVTMVTEMPLLSERERLESSLIALLLRYPLLLSYPDVEAEFVNIELVDETLESLRTDMLDAKEQLPLEVFHTEFQNYLAKKGSNYDINTLCGPGTLFVDRVTTYPIEKAKVIWFLTFKRYWLVVLDGERQQCLHSMTAAEEEKAAAILNEMVKLQLEIRREEEQLEQL